MADRVDDGHLCEPRCSLTWVFYPLDAAKDEEDQMPWRLVGRQKQIANQ